MRAQVEVEMGFIIASVTVKNPNTNSGRIDEHKTNTDFSGDFSKEVWDTNPTGGQ